MKHDLDKLAIRQANALAKSGQELDLLEKRLLLIAMARINRNDTELLTHRIYISEFGSYFAGDPWRGAQKAATGLLQRVVYIEGDDGAFIAFNWTTLARYVPASQSEDGSSYIEIRLNEELAPLLLQLKERYNTIPLLELLPIPSVNSQRLYEILWHDSHAGKKQFLTYDIAILKFQLGLRVPRTVKGKRVWDEKYKPWRDFQKVLRRAQTDFKEYGTLRFTFEGITRGRSTKQVRFCITLAQPTELPSLPIDTPEDPSLQLKKLQVIKALDEAGYRQDPNAAIEAYGLEVVEMAIKLARDAERKAARSNNPILNLGGLIHHSLKTGLAKRHLTQTVDTSPDTKPNARVLAQHLIDAFDNERRQFAETIWEQMSPSQQREFPGIMRLELGSFQVNELEKANWTGVLFASTRNRILIQLYEDMLPEHLCAFEAFLEGNEVLKKDPELKTAVLEQAKAWHQLDFVPT